MRTEMSIRGYATYRGYSDAAIRKAIKAGKILKGVFYVPVASSGFQKTNPKIIKEIADKEYHPESAPQPESNYNGDDINSSNTGIQTAYWVPAQIDTSKGLSGIDLLMWLALRPGMNGREINRIYKLVSAAVDQEKLKLLHSLNKQIKDSEVK